MGRARRTRRAPAAPQGVNGKAMYHNMHIAGTGSTRTDPVQTRAEECTALGKRGRACARKRKASAGAHSRTQTSAACHTLGAAGPTPGSAARGVVARPALGRRGLSNAGRTLPQPITQRISR